MFVRVKKRMLRPTKTAKALAKGCETKPAFALDFLLVESRRAGGQPRQRHLGYLGTIHESAVCDPATRERFWWSVERRLDDLGLRVGTEEGEWLRGVIAARVNPLGRADARRLRLEDAHDPAFLALVARCRGDGEGLYRDAHETSDQLARDQGDDIRLAHVLRFRHAFPLHIRASLLREAWKEARHPSRFDMVEVVSAFRELGTLAYEAGHPPDGSLRVYRAVGPTGLVRGMAWTTDQEKLSVFITRVFLNQKTSPTIRPARVYAATVEPDGVIASFLFEDEVVVDPASLSKVSLLRLVDPEGYE